MKQVVIENPILNSPFAEPTRHFRFTADGITDEIVEGRRLSTYFVPVPQAKKKGRQLPLAIDRPQEKLETREFINGVRERVKVWRQQRWPGVTRTTARLLEHWTAPERDGRRLFFCQIEALETAIYLAEVADRYGESWLSAEVRKANDLANPGLYRLAFKMATGSGKTVVMAMLIAWQSLNKRANPQDPRFSDAFLVVTPGLTIKDRLRVLQPSDPESYYRKMDLLPEDLRGQLGSAKIVITNFHSFLPREATEASKLGRQILHRNRTGVFTESPAQVVARVCRELGGKKGIVVLNDEAHHCYRKPPQAEEAAEETGAAGPERLSAEEKREARRRDEEARVWLSGLEAVQKKLGLRAVYDLSATPFFLKGSGQPEGTLFPWVVSDFALIDAIESGIVKIPRVPVDDDAMSGDLPTYRQLWTRISDKLPKKGRGTEATSGPPILPKELEGALQSLYGHYRKVYARWEANAEARAHGAMPPVFIVVCQNTNISKLLFDAIAGFKKTLPDGSEVLVEGSLPLFSNVQDGRWTPRPASILVDSEQLDSKDGLSDDLKQLLAVEIHEWKSEMRVRNPGLDPEKLTDEAILREVMNTVGKPGKLGAEVRCVVSVSMLTEGWDANTVTHILGVRAFGTQLLCEQVVGRALRRMSYVPNDEGKFDPEYAEVYGVPFSFLPTAPAESTLKTGPTPVQVRALPERREAAITFPRLAGYRVEIPQVPLRAEFTEETRMALSTQDVPSWTENAGVVGEHVFHSLEEMAAARRQVVEFWLARTVCERHFAGEPGRFPEVLRIARRWLDEALTLKDKMTPGYLLLAERRAEAAERIYRSIAGGTAKDGVLLPVLAPYDPVGSTEHVDFPTTRPLWPTRAEKCHVSHVVADTQTWEQKLAQAIEEMPEVVRYVKNAGLGFVIPYTVNGSERRYLPDYLVQIEDGQGPGDLLNLIVEGTGEKDADKEAKVDTARSLWVPAVNRDGSFGRWAFLELRDPWNAQTEIRAFLAGLKAERAA